MKKQFILLLVTVFLLHVTACCQVIPSYIDTKQLAFRKSLEWQPGAGYQASSKNTDVLTVTDKGKYLQQFYLSLNVEALWISGSHINWETGEADKPDATSGTHTHCSAFVAATCKKLGIYILRPPEHKQELLSNAQFDWLMKSAAANSGWKQIQGNNLYEQAQTFANKGMMVIAICKGPDNTKPGHVALIMPREITTENVEKEGPFLIMAGTHNYNRISLKAGFKSHLTEWPEHVVQFYYNINAPQFPANF